MKKPLLLGFSALMFVGLMYKIVETSLESNLFELMAHWGEEGYDPYPWFNATLVDFFGNFTVIALWIFYKETKIWKAVLWLIFMMLMGSPGTYLYIVLQIIKLSSDQGLKELITNRNS